MSKILQFLFHECKNRGYLEISIDTLREHKISKLLSNKSYISDDYKTVYCEDLHDMGIVLTRLDLDGARFVIESVPEDETLELIWIELLEPYNGDYHLGEIPQNTEGLEEFLEVQYSSDFEDDDTGNF